MADMSTTLKPDQAATEEFLEYVELLMWKHLGSQGLSKINEYIESLGPNEFSLEAFYIFLAELDPEIQDKIKQEIDFLINEK